MSLPIQIVDEDDQPVGSATKQEAWEKGLIHRAVRVMVEHPDGRVLLQKRSATKDIFPGCWDNSAAGHVDVGEDYEAAVVRELEEELGLKNVPLQKLGYYYVDETWKGRRMKRFCWTYKAGLEETPKQLEAGKVEAVQWFTVDEVKSLIAEHPDQISDGLRQVFERYY